MHMRVAGIIAEYNPFHSGHMLHIARTRREAGADAVIVAMSGNVVQRGAFSIYSKWSRARAAVACGADLVVELPAVCVLSSAEHYAESGVALLELLGCDLLSFGSECGEIAPLAHLAQILSGTEWLPFFRAEMARGLPFAAARAAAVAALCGPDAAALLSSPNNTLGVEYLRALRARSAPLRPVTIAREGAGHHDSAEAGTASATYLRGQIAALHTAAPGLFPSDRSDEDAASAALSGTEAAQALAALRAYIPAGARRCFAHETAHGFGPVLPEMYDRLLAVRLRALRPEHFAAVSDVSEGLEHRIFTAVQAGGGFSDILRAVKTKRYAYTRVARILLSAALGITAADRRSAPPYARVLALNSRGAELLRAAQERGRIPILTKPAAVSSLSAEAQRCFAVEQRVTDFYALCSPNIRPCALELTTSPFFDGSAHAEQ